MTKKKWTNKIKLEKCDKIRKIDDFFKKYKIQWEKWKIKSKINEKQN